jgi:hypothetical protein
MDIFVDNSQEKQYPTLCYGKNKGIPTLQLTKIRSSRGVAQSIVGLAFYSVANRFPC